MALPHLQYAIITYYDLHIMLLEELQYNVITYRKKQNKTKQTNKIKKEKNDLTINY